MALIKDRKLASDTWQQLEGGVELLSAVPESADVLVPLQVWKAARATLLSRSGQVGVVLTGADEPAEIASDIVHFAVIAVHFPQFTDGRGYSVGRVLRERYGWKGELRATGDVQRDQLAYLTRCGYNAFDLRLGEDGAAALTAFSDFSEVYQCAVDQPLPLFRRRAAVRAGAGA
jgi:uncharacterized protein (DUF934 family)